MPAPSLYLLGSPSVTNTTRSAGATPNCVLTRLTCSRPSCQFVAPFGLYLLFIQFVKVLRLSEVTSWYGTTPSRAVVENAVTAAWIPVSASASTKALAAFFTSWGRVESRNRA